MRRLFRLAGREPGVEDDVRAELESHLAMKVEAPMAAGLGREEAEVEARQDAPAEEVYLPYTWNPWAWTSLVVRTAGESEPDPLAGDAGGRWYRAVGVALGPVGGWGGCRAP